MRNCLSAFLLLTIFLSSTPIYAQETAPRRTATRGDGAGYSTRDASVLSMMGWGLGLALGIALLCGYLEDVESVHSGSTDNSTTGGGGTAH
jgi:hypothetical protein